MDAPKTPQEFVAILKRGQKRWNQWRKDNPDIVPNFEGVDFTNAEEFAGTEIWGRPPEWTRGVLDPEKDTILLEGFDLRGSGLCDVHLESVNLLHTHLEGADLMFAHLEGAGLMGAQLEGAQLICAHLEGASLRAANLEGALLMKAHLDGADLSHADLSNADLSGVSIVGADMRGANLQGAKVMGIRYMRRFGDPIVGKVPFYLLPGLWLWLYRVARRMPRARRPVRRGLTALRRCFRCRALNRLVHRVRMRITQHKTYGRSGLHGKYLGINAAECYGDADFRRDAMDQDYIDKKRAAWRTPWWNPNRALLLWPWAFLDYGRSLWRVVALSVLLVGVFGFLYTAWAPVAGGVCPTGAMARPGAHVEYIESPGGANVGVCNWFTPYYAAAVSFSTLGFTDVIRPTSLVGQWVLMLNVLAGYFVLGLLMAILAHTVARRS
ncbi:MAG TPA: hypothetical protein DDX54_02000 [Rhodospirillaceae bacterium]|jgi:uncharacterized protein YjbI with pentapeptide repeats|nr:pentapeptide repeat-containing protein [Alphaproteobacteria bacterium]HBH26159.1 hypothetical protein [Rhodospirillaceae bacterium]